MSGRMQRQGGGTTSHNLFSWNDDVVQTNTKPYSSQEAGLDSPTRSVGAGRLAQRSPASQLGSQIFFGEGGEEEQPRNRSRPGAARKLEELSGSGIFSPGPANNEPVVPERSSVRLHQPAGGASQITFGSDSDITPKKVLSNRKMSELSGTPPTDDRLMRRQFSAAKIRELNGSLSIFSSPSAPDQAKLRGDPNSGTSYNDGKPVRVSKPVGGASSIVFGEVEPEPFAPRASERKVKDLLGTGEYKEESPTLPVSEAKRRELRGCDIFADEQPQFRDSLAGIRQPPGGDSSIALI